MLNSYYLANFHHRRLLVQILLEAAEHLADLFRPAKVGDGIGDGIVVFQAQQRTQLLHIKLFDADIDVVREDEIQESLLLYAKS